MLLEEPLSDAFREKFFETLKTVSAAAGVNIDSVFNSPEYLRENANLYRVHSKFKEALALESEWTGLLRVFEEYALQIFEVSARPFASILIPIQLVGLRNVYEECLDLAELNGQDFALRIFQFLPGSEKNRRMLRLVLKIQARKQRLLAEFAEALANRSAGTNSVQQPQVNGLDAIVPAVTVEVKWPEIEILFLSEFKLQVRNGEAYSYAELGFADTRGGKQKPNLAWGVFQKLAIQRGRISFGSSGPERTRTEKQIQLLRKLLQKHFGFVRGNPIEFVKDANGNGYRAKFKISCASSYSV